MWYSIHLSQTLDEKHTMFGIPEDHFDSQFPTSTMDLVHDQASELGRNRPDQAWISTSWDVWARNPHYHGPAVPHPEDEYVSLCQEEEGAIDEVVSLDDEDTSDTEVPY